MRASRGPGLARSWACIALALQLETTAAQPQTIDATTLAAAYVYNFGLFTEWPAGTLGSPDQPMVLCTNDRDAAGSALQALAGRSLRDRSLVVRQIQRPADGAGCHLFYAQDPQEPTAAALLRSLESRPVLTVARDVDVDSPVAIINLVQLGGRLRWTVNLDAARRSGVRLSSKITEMAVKVIDGGAAPGTRP